MKEYLEKTDDYLKSCDYCKHQEGKHYCLYHERTIKNMDTLTCLVHETRGENLIPWSDKIKEDIAHIARMERRVCGVEEDYDDEWNIPVDKGTVIDKEWKEKNLKKWWGTYH